MSIHRIHLYRSKMLYAKLKHLTRVRFLDPMWTIVVKTLCNLQWRYLLRDDEEINFSFQCCTPNRSPPSIWRYNDTTRSFDDVSGQSFSVYPVEIKNSGCDDGVIIICGEHTDEGYKIYSILQLITNSSVQSEISWSSISSKLTDTVESDVMKYGHCKYQHVFEIYTYPIPSTTTIPMDDVVYSSVTTSLNRQSSIWFNEYSESFTDINMAKTVKFLVPSQRSNGPHPWFTPLTHTTVTFRITLIIAMFALIFSMWTPVRQCYKFVKGRNLCSVLRHDDNDDDEVYPMTQNLNNVLSPDMTLPSESQTSMPENTACQVGTTAENQVILAISGNGSEYDSPNLMLPSGECPTRRRIGQEENKSRTLCDECRQEYSDEREPTHNERQTISNGNRETDQEEHLYFSFDDAGSCRYDASNEYARGEQSKLQRKLHQMQDSFPPCQNLSLSPVPSLPRASRPSDYNRKQNEEVSFLSDVAFESYPECLYAMPGSYRQSNDDQTSLYPTSDGTSNKSIMSSTPEDDIQTSCQESNGCWTWWTKFEIGGKACLFEDTEDKSWFYVSPCDSSLSLELFLMYFCLQKKKKKKSLSFNHSIYHIVYHIHIVS